MQGQIAAGDATSLLIAKMQQEQLDALERTRLLHEEASASNSKIQDLSALLAGQAQLLKNLEGTVGTLTAGLTTLEGSVGALNANVSDIATELRAFIAASMAKDKPSKSADDGKSPAARSSDHSPSRQRSPRGLKHRGSDDSTRSDPGGAN